MLKKNITRFVVLAVVFALTMSISGVCFADSMSERTTMEVIDHHLQAASAMDVEGIVSDYSEDCVIINSMNADPIVGRDGVRAWLKNMLPSYLTKLTGSIKMDITKIMNFTKKTACGEGGMIMFQMNPIMHGNESYCIQNGYIQVETVCFYMGSAKVISF